MSQWSERVKFFRDISKPGTELGLGLVISGRPTRAETRRHCMRRIIGGRQCVDSKLTTQLHWVSTDTGCE